MQLLAAEGIHQHQLNVQKSTRFIGIKVGKSNYSKNELNETKLPVRVIAQTAKTRSGWDTVLEGTEFKTTLSGADIQAGVGEKARADAKIILKGIVNRIQTEEKLESNSTVWQKQAGSGSTVETLKLPSFEGPALPKLTAPGGYIADIPKGNLKTEIEKLAKQPEYAYLKQLQTVKDVNWNQVQLAYDKWDYKQEGLTGAGAAIIALAVAAVTGGVGAGLIGAAQGTASAAVADAAFTALVSQASISLINNKGNIGNTLKELGRSRTVKNLVVAAATAGVADKIGASALNNISDKQWVNDLTVNLANAGSAALINTTVNGGSLKDNLEANILAALVNTAHGEAASKIKQLDHHYITHKIAHAIAGCAAAAANKGKCQDGAIGAAVGEILGETLLDSRDPGSLNVKDRAKIIAKAKLAAGTVAALSKGDVNAAANAAAVAVESNALSKERMDKLTKCLSGKTCSTTMEKVNAIKKDEQFSKVIDTEIQKVCSRNPLGDGCRNGINMSIKYIAMPAAWKYMPTDVSRFAKEVFGYLYNSQGASTRFDKYFNTIDNRADFFAASNLYEQNLGSKARWFGGADFVSRAAITGLGADGEASYITFAAGKVVGNPPIYEWRAASGNALIVNGFYNFRDLFNKKTNPREWDIQQLKSEQKLLQPIHQKYLSNEKDYLSLIKGVTSNKIFSIIPNPLDERKKIEDGINC
ncbi:TPA: DUF637 domain-containing protein [Neisseria meningitidis]|uniref:DUF637 domain-containing protein n=1 Tax=Neisseria meningitidis TaxID=487 RepID=UPI00031CEAA4|nr:S-layer family protein [Neisseria meningitidis]MCL5824967.1 S-layer family protein [Neisseria meningitidis]MCV6689392.1 S-layer family protein [Neisseria meningitidis]